MKKEKIYILIMKDHKKYKKEVNARTFEKKGEKFGIVGNCKSGYSLTHIGTGLALDFDISYKNICAKAPELIEKLKNLPTYYIKHGEKMFQEAEILKEV